MKQKILEILDKSTNNGIKANEINSLVREEALKNLVSAAQRIRDKTLIDDIKTINTADFVRLLVKELMKGETDGE